MKNIKNNLIFSGLILFTFLAFYSLPNNASAYYYVGWVNGNYIGCETDLDNYGNFVGCGNINTTMRDYYNYHTAQQNNTTKTNTTTKTKNITVSKNTDNSSDNSTENSKYDLSANALFGSNGFMPSTFLQWFFVLILILFIIILWRKIYVGDKYKAKPLKHA
ncbi:MAG: hypothetical protein WCO07_00480 [bacterium]